MKVCIREIMTRDVATCRPSDTLSRAAQLMWDHNCGCVPVVEDAANRVIGMLTDRDICMATYFRAAPPGALAVEEIMSRDVRSVRASETLADAEAVMRDAQVRRLPVLDEDLGLVGLISLADLARDAACRRSHQERAIVEAGLCETLEDLSTVRTSHPAPEPAWAQA